MVSNDGGWRIAAEVVAIGAMDHNLHIGWHGRLVCDECVFWVISYFFALVLVG